MYCFVLFDEVIEQIAKILHCLLKKNIITLKIEVFSLLIKNELYDKYSFFLFIYSKPVKII